MTSSENDQNQAAPPESRPVTPQDSSAQRSVIESSELVGRDGTVQILHSGETYTLRVTRNNRLILTK